MVFMKRAGEAASMTTLIENWRLSATGGKKLAVAYCLCEALGVEDSRRHGKSGEYPNLVWYGTRRTGLTEGDLASWEW